MAICLRLGEQTLDPSCEPPVWVPPPLSVGEKAAIGVSSAAAAVFLGVFLFYWLRDRRKKRLNAGVVKPASTTTPRESGVELRDQEPRSQPNNSNTAAPPPYSV